MVENVEEHVRENQKDVKERSVKQREKRVEKLVERSVKQREKEKLVKEKDIKNKYVNFIYGNRINKL